MDLEVCSCMIIETERLILRRYTYDDFKELYEILNDPITMKYYPKVYNEEETRRWIRWNLDNYEKYGFGLWAIELKDSKTFIGDCGLTIQKIDNEFLPEIGYHINKKYWLNGYAKEAGKAVRDWAFVNTKYECLYSYMTSLNVASYSTAKSIGMKKIKEYIDDNEINFVYAITKDMWNRR